MYNPQVTIILPTYNTRESIFKLLYGLLLQSYKKFNVIIVYKPWRGYKTVFARISEYKGLDIDFVKQDEGFFEEALNTAYRKADGDVMIHTDDDALVSKDWIKNHVELHVKHEKIGMATGRVIEDIYPNGTSLPFFKKLINDSKWRMNRHTIIDKPLDNKFKDYGMYVGNSGMLVDTGKKYGMIKTLKQHGVNMSWKYSALSGFKLPGYTKNAGGNEAAAALEVINRGYLPIWFDGAVVSHPAQESLLSRSASVFELPQGLTEERVLFAYYTNMFSDYKIDPGVLKFRTDIDAFISRFIAPKASKGYTIGYKLASKAIEGCWKPSAVRRELINNLKGE